jgi:hypothetical protein
MIKRWISDVPSKIVKFVEVRAVSAGSWPDDRGLVSTNSAPQVLESPHYASGHGDSLRRGERVLPGPAHLK